MIRLSGADLLIEARIDWEKSESTKPFEEWYEPAERIDPDAMYETDDELSDPVEVEAEG